MRSLIICISNQIKVNVYSPGIGLGLSNCRKLIEHLGGTLELISSVTGKGSHFRVQLNCKTAPNYFVYPWKKTSLTYTMLYPYANRNSDSNAMKSFRCNLQDEGIKLGNEDSDIILIEAFEDLTSTTVFDYLLTGKQALVILCDSGFSNRIADIPSKLQHRIFLAFEPAATLRVREVLSEAYCYLQRTEKSTSSSPANTPLQSSPCISTLIVDDNKLNRDIIAMYIKKSGYTWAEAKDGQEAVDMYNSKSPCDFRLILMDVQMYVKLQLNISQSNYLYRPNMDGISATKLIRDAEANHQSQRSKIIVLTGLSDENTMAEALSAGADGVKLFNSMKQAMR
jgi:CheY-like chemotaxis protein